MALYCISFINPLQESGHLHVVDLSFANLFVVTAPVGYLIALWRLGSRLLAKSNVKTSNLESELRNDIRGLLDQIRQAPRPQILPEIVRLPNLETRFEEALKIKESDLRAQALRTTRMLALEAFFNGQREEDINLEGLSPQAVQSLRFMSEREVAQTLRGLRKLG